MNILNNKTNSKLGNTKRVKLNLDSFAFSRIAEKITKVIPKATFESEDQFFIIVPRGKVGKAIGKGAQNIKKLSNVLKKRVKIIEFDPNIKKFILNITSPLKIETITEEDGRIILSDPIKKTKSLLIGRGGKNLKLLNEIIERFFHKEVLVK